MIASLFHHIPSEAPIMMSFWVIWYGAIIRLCKLPPMRCGHHLGWSNAALKMQNQNTCNCNHVLESWHVLLKTSYLHSLTETLEWSIVLWLVNHSNCLNGQWLVSQSLILRPTHKLSNIFKSGPNFLIAYVQSWSHMPTCGHIWSSFV